jgi:hypothetical protein
VALWHDIHFGFLTAATRVEAIQGVEATLVTVICLALLAAVALRTAGGQAERWEWFLIPFVLVFWLFPLTQAKVSYWRSDALLVPAALLIVRILAYFFFTNKLV